ncbi:hypothetical protein B296_00025917, partial [Ensete ventricosum]
VGCQRPTTLGHGLPPSVTGRRTYRRPGYGRHPCRQPAAGGSPQLVGSLLVGIAFMAKRAHCLFAGIFRHNKNT